MTTNFGFGSLTGVNGQKVDWDTLKKYDANQDGAIDAVEYHAMLKEMDPDGFKGITAFGTMNANGDKIITEEEFKVMEQKVAMAEYVDKLFEDLASASGLTASYQNAVTAYLKFYAEEFVKEYPDNVDEMSNAFKQDLVLFIEQYQNGVDKINEIKENPDYATDLVNVVKDGNENGYISAEERAVINEAATNYALQLVLKGDYTFLISLGVASKDISNLKVTVAKLNRTCDPEGVLDEIKSQIAGLINKSDANKIVSNVSKIEDQIKAKEAAKNEKPAEAYTITALELDYSGIKGYKENSGVTKDQAAKLIEQLRKQVIEQLKAKCAAKGLNFDETLVNTIFDVAKTARLENPNKSTPTTDPKYPYNVKTLIDHFINKFNKLMETATEKLAAEKLDPNGVPKLAAITSNYLDVPDSKLTREQKALKNLQKDLLIHGDKVIKGTSEATTIIDTVAAEVKAEMLASLGDSYKNVITNIIANSKDETLAKVTGKTTKLDVVKNFISLVKTKFADYKENKTSLTA